MAKVLMTAKTKGSPDGLKVVAFEKDTEYDIPAGLAKVFVEQMKVATYVSERPRREERNAGDAPENKAAAATEVKEEKDEKPKGRR